MSDAPSQVQEDDWQYTQEAVNGPLVVGAAMVPLADAEKLATALELAWREAHGSHRAVNGRAVCRMMPCPHLRETLAEFRAAHPREETWQAEEIEAARERAEQTAEMLDWREETTD